MVKHINVAKKGIKKLAREVAARNIIAVAPADKAVERKSVTANVIRNASQRRANVKGNVVIIAAPRRVKQTSVVRIKRSKKFISKVIQRTVTKATVLFVLLIQDKLAHLVELPLHIL